MGLKVVATPSWQDNMQSWRDKLGKFVAKPGSGYSYSDYSDPQALLDYLAALLKNSDDCLEILEIVAHGNPSSCNGIFLTVPTPAPPLKMSADALGTGLAALRLCKNFELYLTGCNTGCSEVGAGPGLRPMGEVLAKKLKKKVHGATGFVTYGSHATGDTKVDSSSYEGASSGHGDGAYKEFKP